MAKGMKTGGRVRGTPNKTTAAIAASGMTPLDFLVGVMRDDTKDLSVRIDAGKAAAPYVHPRLASMVNAQDPNKPMSLIINGIDVGL